MVTSVRISARDQLGITGNPVEDFFASLLYYPGVAVQLKHAVDDVAAAKQRSGAASQHQPPTEVVSGGNHNPAYVPEVREISKL